MSNLSLVEIQKDHSVGVIYLKNSDLNLLSVQFINQLNRCLDTLESDEEISVIVIASTQKVFSAGANLQELLLETEATRDVISNWQHLAEITKPVICCVNGACLGGGLELALMCDIIVASDQATFGFPEVNLGLLPGGGGTKRVLQRISKARAMEMIMFGELISSAKAVEWGLINHIYGHSTCFDDALALAKKLTAKNAQALSAIKRLSILHDKKTIGDSLRDERIAFYERLFSADGKKNIKAFLNRKKSK
jgi:enoyl-CoA hydratase